jgi:hypothetical protein
MIWLKWSVIAAGSLILIVAGMAWYGAWRWAAATRALQTQLENARITPPPSHYDAREIEGLPAPVQRYFRSVLADGQPIVRAATVAHTGTFNMGEAADQWRPFRSTQRVITQRPGFVWDGRVALLPGLNVHVHDAYMAGVGILHPAILGLFSLADLRGGADMAQGELMRFFAEAAWYPTALLPSQGVRWEPVDDRHARATLRDGDTAVTLTFAFAADGPMDSVRAEARGRTVAGQVVPTPWEGRWSNVQAQGGPGGMRVPMTGEVAWLTPQGRKPYWRGTITQLRYEFSP